MEGSQKKFVVDEGGNRRQEITGEDIKQALNDITQWFKTNAPTYYTMSLEGSKGSQEQEVDQLLKQFGAESS
jgi:hypothetical protein